MIVQCPECKARYMVPDQSLGAAGRNVRCARCTHTWFQAGPKEAEVLGDLDKLLDEINARPIPPGSNLPAVVAEPTSLLFKVGVLAAIFVLVALALLLAAPGVYGLPRSTGMSLSDVTSLKLTRDQHTVYQIDGKILNTTDHAMKVPRLRIMLVDDDGKSVQQGWEFYGDVKMLEAGKSVPFTSGDLELRTNKGTRFVVDLGNQFEMSLRHRP